MKINKENLLKMADHIETVPPETFDMGCYWDDIEPECNSVGCIIGHCTKLDPNINRYLDSDGDIKFTSWSEDFTGIGCNTSAWDYLFSHEWAAVDNTRTGAAKRIRYFVEHGLPEDWKDQMNGYAPWSYLTPNV